MLRLARFPFSMVCCRGRGKDVHERIWQAIAGEWVAEICASFVQCLVLHMASLRVPPPPHLLPAGRCPRPTDVQVVDARMYQVVACLSHPKFRTVSSFSRACLSPSATYAAAASANGNVYVWDIARSTGSGDGKSVAFASSGAGAGTSSSSSSAVVTVLQTHGVAASGCDWCLNMPSTLASCDSKGGLRVWG